MTLSILVLALSAAICALTAGFSVSALSAARKIRSLSSLQGEIAEIDSSVQTLIGVIRRIEGRQTARLGREKKEVAAAAPEHVTPTSLMDKAELRRYVGLTPGRPAPHGDVHKSNSA